MSPFGDYDFDYPIFYEHDFAGNLHRMEFWSSEPEGEDVFTYDCWLDSETQD